MENALAAPVLLVVALVAAPATALTAFIAVNMLVAFLPACLIRSKVALAVAFVFCFFLSPFPVP